MNRLVGLETEYGCLAPKLLPLPTLPERVRDHLFHQRHLGLIDLHYRDYDEPAGNGGFLFNGGRLYLDMGHVEYCTPECKNLHDVIAYDIAGEQLLQSALQELQFAEEAAFYKNNIDHYTGATFGCHENYLMRRDAPLNTENVDSLLTFLSLRLLMSGAGRVGAAHGRQSQIANGDPDWIGYQISQRADYIQTDIYEWVQFNRAIINARDEPLADGRRFRRLHLLQGDSSILPFCAALKVGSTALILDLIEADLLPHLPLKNPVHAFHQLSRLPDGPWEVDLADGSTLPALDLLEQFYHAAATADIPRDADSAWTLSAWRETLDALQNQPDALIGKIDWITKRFILDSYRDGEQLPWNDPMLASLDLEYHHLDPAKNLALSLPGTDLAEQSLPQDSSPRDFQFEPPTNTRASLRSRAMREAQELRLPYYIDWDEVIIENGPHLQLPDPFLHV